MNLEYWLTLIQYTGAVVFVVIGFFVFAKVIATILETILK